MAITSLYKNYFQKSRIFMYPILEIKRGSSVTPIETYVSWDGQYSPKDMKLISLYHLRDDAQFIKFEKEKLVGNKYFHSFKEIEDKKAVYVFDFSEFAKDWIKIINGKYSQISYSYKKKIENFYGRRDSNYAYVESFLYPEKYYKMYSEIINVPENVLREVGELCSKMDIEKETLHAKIKNLELRPKSV